MDIGKIKFHNDLTVVFSKTYVDYLLKSITIKNKLGEDETCLITKEKRRYYTTLSLNIIVFSYYMKNIYSIGMGMNSKYKNRGYLGMLIYTSATLCTMVIVANFAEYKYYHNLKFLLMKYNYVSDGQIFEANLNKKIIEQYVKQSL